MSTVARRWTILAIRGAVSVVVFAALSFVMMEIGYRFYREGFVGAFESLRENVPHSNLGTSDWVVSDRELGFRLNPDELAINALSIRHPPIVVPKPKGVYRIVFLGDSIAWDRPGFVDLVESALEPTMSVEVINASVPGYTAYQELRFFERYVRQTGPDLVIWSYCLNDNHRFLHRFDERARMLWTAEAKQSLEIDSVWEEWASRSYVLTSARAILSSWEREAAIPKGRFEWESRIDFNIAWKDYSWSSYESYLRAMKEMLEEDGAKLVVVVFPIEPQLARWRDARSRDYVEKPQRALAKLCDKHGVPCLDLLPVFLDASRRRPTLFRDGIHLNGRGHDVTARALHGFLEDHALLGGLP